MQHPGQQKGQKAKAAAAYMRTATSRRDTAMQFYYGIACDIKGQNEINPFYV